MSDLKGLFENLYSRFILRDVLGKALPGTLVLLAVALWWAPPGSVIEWFAGDHSWGFWLFFFSSAWLLGLAIQFFAEYFRFLEYFPPGLRSLEKKCVDQYNSEFFVAVRDFLKAPSNEEHSNRNERFEVIKESCGNASASLVLAAGVLVARLGFEIGVNHNGPIPHGALRLVLVFLVVLGIVFLLYRMHLENCVRQYTYAWRLLSMEGRIQEDGTIKLTSKNGVTTYVQGWRKNGNLRLGGLNKCLFCLPMVCIGIWVAFGVIGMLSGVLLKMPLHPMWITDP